MGRKIKLTPCHNCGKDCRPWVYYGMDHDLIDHHYCSQACFDAHRKTWETTCKECGYRAVRSKWPDGYWSGFSGAVVFCSRECYDKQFVECLTCHKKDATVKANMNTHKDFWRPDLPEQICDDCYNKKHNLVAVWLRWG